jgi:hypothetical protein
MSERNALIIPSPRLGTHPGYSPTLDTTYQLSMAAGEYLDFKVYINAPSWDVYFVTSGVSAPQYNITTTILSTLRPAYVGGRRQSNSGRIVLAAGEAGRFIGYYVARISLGAPPYTLYSTLRFGEEGLTTFRFGVYVYTTPPSNATTLGTRTGWLDGIDLSAYLVLIGITLVMSVLFLVMLRNSRQQARLRMEEAMELGYAPVFELRERPQLFTALVGVDGALALGIKQQAFRLKGGRVGQLRGAGAFAGARPAGGGGGGSGSTTPTGSTPSLFARMLPKTLSMGSLFGASGSQEPAEGRRRWVRAFRAWMPPPRA